MKNICHFRRNKISTAIFFVAKLFERYGLTQQAEQIYLQGKQIARNEKYPAIELMKYYINQKDYPQAAVEIVESQKGAIVQPSQLYSYLQNTFRDQTMVTQVIDQVEHQLIVQQEQLTDPQRSDLYYCLYVFASQIGDYDRSIPFFTAFFTLSPNKYDDLMQFVATLEDGGFYREASSLLDLLPEDSPIFTKAVQKRAQLLIKQGNPKKALQLLQTYPQGRNDYLYARALVETGNASAGLHVLRGIAKPSPPCTLLEARIAMINHQFEDAADIFATIDKSAGSNYIKALYGAGLAYLFNNSFDNALEKFEEVCHLYAHSPEARDAIDLRALIALISATGNEQLIGQWINAEYFLWSDNTTGAITGFENLLSLNNDAPYTQNIRMRLFRLYASDTQYDKALSQLDSIVEDNPTSDLGAWAMHMKIELQEKINGREINQDDFAQLLESYPDSYDADIIRRDLEKKRTEHALSPAM